MALLIAGIFAVLAGLLAILFGFTVRESSLGSTLIIAGTIGVCSGMLLAGLYVVVAELKGIARRLAGSAAPAEVRVRPVLPGLAVPGAPASAPLTGAGDERLEPQPPAAGLPPWQSEAAARERPRAEPPPEPEAPTPPAAPEAPRRRNLLFASTSRKERERAEAKADESLPPQPHAEPAEPAGPESSARELRRCLAEAGPYAAAGAAGRTARRPPPRSPSTFSRARARRACRPSRRRPSRRP